MVRRTPVQLLMFDLDDGVLHGRLAATRERHLEYASRLGGLSVIIHSPIYKGASTIQVSDDVTYYVSDARTRLGFVVDAYRIAGDLCTRGDLNLIVAQEPFLCGFVGSCLRRRFGVPLIVDLHAEFFAATSGWRRIRLRNRLLGPVGLWFLRSADAIRAVSASIRQTLLDRGFPADKIFIAPVAVTRAVMERARIAESREESLQAPFRLLFAGRLVEQKNIPTLLEAARLLADRSRQFRLVIVGDGPLRESLRRKVKVLGLQSYVEFLGWQSQSQVAEHYETSSVFVLSSTFEGTPLVLMECSLHGLPAVTTAVDGCSEVVIHGETGLVVRSGRSDELADAIEWLMDHPYERQLFSERARARAARMFDRDRAISDLVERWHLVAQNNACRAYIQRSS